MGEERVFSEHEVGEIIRRAVQLTEEGASQPYRAGVTKAELERIADEVGVNAEALRRAILEAGERKGKRGPLHLTEEFERVIEGEIDPGQFDILTEGIKPVTNVGQPGLAQVGRSLNMSAWTGVSQAKIDVTSRNGRTRLKVKSNAFFPMLMALYPGLMGSIITIGSLGERGMVWLGLAIAAAIMTVAAFVFTLLTKHGHRKAEKLTDDLRDRIVKAVAEQESAKGHDATIHAEEEKEVRLRLGE